MNKSNNDIMWDCLVDIFSNSVDPLTEHNVVDFVYSYKENDGKEVKYNFSNDNWLAISCWMHKFYPKSKHNIPTFGHHALHPIRFFRFLFMKYTKTSTVIFPIRLIVCIEMILGATVFARKTESGKLHTSGILLDYYLCRSYKMKFMMKLLTLIVEYRSWKSWKHVFKTYHGDKSRYNYKVFKSFLAYEKC